MQLEFWFEFASTYSHPAALRIEARARERGVRVLWRAFLLGPIFREQGWNDSPFNLYPAKGRYMWRDLERICEGHGVPYRRPTAFPRNGLLAARVACAFAEEAWLPEFVRRAYLANFALDRDIGSEEVVAACLGEAGRWLGRRIWPAAALRATDRVGTATGCRGQRRAGPRHLPGRQSHRRSGLGQRSSPTSQPLVGELQLTPPVRRLCGAPVSACLPWSIRQAGTGVSVEKPA